MSEHIHCALCGASELGCRDGDCCDDCGHEGRVMTCACRRPGHRVACPQRPVTGARGGAVPVRLPRPDLADIGAGGLIAAAWRAGA